MWSADRSNLLDTIHETIGENVAQSRMQQISKTKESLKKKSTIVDRSKSPESSMGDIILLGIDGTVSSAQIAEKLKSPNYKKFQLITHPEKYITTLKVSQDQKSCMMQGRVQNKNGQEMENHGSVPEISKSFLNSEQREYEVKRRFSKR